MQKNSIIGFIGAVAVFVFATGCALFQTAAPLAVPATTCAILDRQPAAQPYLAALEVAVRNFSENEDLSAEALRNALMEVKIDGVKPYVASGAYSVVVIAYGGLVEKYATDPAREIHLRAALIAIGDGLAAGISQCGIPANPQIVSLRGPILIIDEKNLDKLTKAMAKSLQY